MSIVNKESNNNININFEQSHFNGSLIIGCSNPGETRTTSDCTKKQIWEKAENTANMIQVLLAVFVSILDLLALVIPLYSNAAFGNPVLWLGIFILLVGIIVGFLGLWKCLRIRKMKRSGDLTEIPTMRYLLALIISTLTDNPYDYLPLGRLCRYENGMIVQYKNAGECPICELEPKGTIEIHKIENKHYQGICNKNVNHIFEIDFQK